jgi:hypothetical protein
VGPKPSQSSQRWIRLARAGFGLGPGLLWLGVIASVCVSGLLLRSTLKLRRMLDSAGSQREAPKNLGSLDAFDLQGREISVTPADADHKTSYLLFVLHNSPLRHELLLWNQEAAHLGSPDVHLVGYCSDDFTCESIGAASPNLQFTLIKHASVMVGIALAEADTRKKALLVSDRGHVLREIPYPGNLGSRLQIEQEGIN